MGLLLRLSTVIPVCYIGHLVAHTVLYATIVSIDLIIIALGLDNALDGFVILFLLSLKL